MTEKITLTMPADLIRRAKATAALRGESISAVVRRALAEYVQEALSDAQDNRDLDELERRIEAGEEPLFTHDEVWAEIARLEAEGAPQD